MTRLEERITACERMAGIHGQPYDYEKLGLTGECDLSNDELRDIEQAQSIRNAYERGLSDRATMLKLEE